MMMIVLQQLKNGMLYLLFLWKGSSKLFYRIIQTQSNCLNSSFVFIKMNKKIKFNDEKKILIKEELLSSISKSRSGMKIVCCKYG